MAAPFIFIGTHAIKEGKLEEFKETALELVRLVREMEPRMIAFNFYLNEDETEATIVQVHPDADSMLHHMQVARQHIMKGTEDLLVTKGIQIYGLQNDVVLDMIAELSQSDVPLDVKPHHIDGVTRSSAG